MKYNLSVTFCSVPFSWARTRERVSAGIMAPKVYGFAKHKGDMSHDGHIIRLCSEMLYALSTSKSAKCCSRSALLSKENNISNM